MYVPPSLAGAGASTSMSSIVPFVFVIKFKIMNDVNPTNLTLPESTAAAPEEGAQAKSTDEKGVSAETTADSLAAMRLDNKATDEKAMLTNGSAKSANHVRRLPFDKPSEVSSLPSSSPPDLTSHQADHLKAMHDHFSQLPDLPTALPKKGKHGPIPTASLSESERFFVTREAYLRYLRATKWNLTEAKKRLEATLVWRRDYGVERLDAALVEPEGTTGKQIILGYDNACRPCLYLNPSRQNTPTSPRQIQFLVWSLESVTDLMPKGVETLSLLVNFKSSSSSSNPSPSTGRQVLHILQNHYPERLGRALVIQVPTFVWLFFKLITPFIDPMTREKLKFNEDLRTHVPPVQLDKSFGGDCEFEYVHEEYWPALIELAKKRREAMFSKWKALGGHIGTSEYDLK